MYRNRRYIRWIWGIAVSALCLSSCTPSITEISPELDLPEYYLRLTAEDEEQKIRSLSSINWQEYFSDSHLKELITTALRGNQELDILLQELEIAKNEVSARHGAVLPSVELGVEAGLEKVGELTRDGAVEQSTEIAPGKSFPDPLKDFTVGAFAHWEVDIWRKLRNAEKAAVYRYSATVEGRNFFITQLVAEVANIYYELIALDWQLKLVEQNIGIQTDALTAVRVKKESARVTELALRRFEAQLFKTKGLRYDIQQKII
ncbi:TolC family protein, partial [bacterium]|nr:TolC family protein [bacterium]